jgi:outer membrane protein W
VVFYYEGRIHEPKGGEVTNLEHYMTRNFVVHIGHVIKVKVKVKVNVNVKVKVKVKVKVEVKVKVKVNVKVKVKVKVKLHLYLTKHHAMKLYCGVE